MRRAAGELVAFGALSEDGETLHLSPAAEKVLRARFAAVQPGDQIAQIKVTLLDSDPPVWRRLLVPTTMRLDRLDHVIQAAMGWTNSHLHMFIHPTGHYGTPDLDLPMHDERKATFRDLAAREGDTFGYEYDFGDSWTHEVLLEELVPAEPTGRYPACTDGACACPPETAAAPPDIRKCSTRSPTRTILITTIYEDGWAWSRAPTSIPHVSTPPTSTGASPQ